MKLRFSRKALAELREIANYIRERNPAAAVKVQRAILDTIAMVTRSPELGRKQTLGMRKLVVRKYPYLVYYAFDKAAKQIVVHKIRHAARAHEHQDV